MARIAFKRKIEAYAPTIHSPVLDFYDIIVWKYDLFPVEGGLKC